MCIFQKPFSASSLPFRLELPVYQRRVIVTLRLNSERVQIIDLVYIHKKLEIKGSLALTMCSLIESSNGHCILVTVTR